MSHLIQEDGCVVLGCGNVLLGDDGFGPRVIEALQAEKTPSYSLPLNVQFIDAGTSVQGLLFDMLLSERKPGKVIVVDAMDLPGRRPGDVFEVDLDLLTPAKRTGFSAHQFPGMNLLQEIRDHTPIRLHVLAVQMDRSPSEVCPDLSPPVEAAIPAMCAKVMDCLEA